MVNKNKWISNYKKLNPDNQIEVAEAIINELKGNESIFAEKEYNKDKSKTIREVLSLIELSQKKSEELKKMRNVLCKFENLSQNNKFKVANEIFEIVVKYLNIQEQESKEMVCHNEGHTYGKWQHNKWIEYIDTIIDHQHIKNFPVEHENWERMCTRCGYVDVVKYEPQELINARKEKNKKARIKRLEKTLQRLKDE